MTINVWHVIIIFTAITLIILERLGVFTPKDKPPVKVEQEQITTPYITPTMFQTGYITNLPSHQKIADNCGNNMYPVNAPYVNYGLPQTTSCCGNECDVNIFNSAP
jgi:uncharacterized alpha/beta hydrolase family protein